jgi:hypothetical protein
MLSLTDTASAAAYGLQSAKLSRAGDNSPDRTFIAPDAGGLTAGIEGMRPGADPSVLEADPSADAPLGYPLTALTYAMIRPLTLDVDARSDYASFIDYAVSGGQVSGLEPGQLPRGFATLPEELRDQAKASAVTIRDLQPPPGAAPVAPAAPASPSPAPSSSSGGASSVPSSGSRTSVTTTPTAAAAPPAPPVAAVAVGPEGESSTLLTPVLALARNRFVIPVLAGVALLSALAALEISKRPRRGVPSASPVSAS